MNILLVVDMQNDFIDGALGTEEALVVLPKVVEKIKNFKGKIFYTRDTHSAGYLETQEGKNLPVPHCIEGSSGWQLHPLIDELFRNGAGEKEAMFDKPGFGSVDLMTALQAVNEKTSIESITLVGLCTDICVIVHAMLCKAYFPEVEIVVDGACCAGVTPESHYRALEAMKVCQIRIIN